MPQRFDHDCSRKKMSICDSIFQIGKQVGGKRHLAEMKVYSSSNGGYLKISERSPLLRLHLCPQVSAEPSQEP